MNVDISCGACGMAEGHKHWCVYARNPLAEVVPQQTAYDRAQHALQCDVQLLKEFRRFSEEENHALKAEVARQERNSIKLEERLCAALQRIESLERDVAALKLVERGRWENAYKILPDCDHDWEAADVYDNVICRKCHVTTPRTMAEGR